MAYHVDVVEVAEEHFLERQNLYHGIELES
jgi:hypothetical protein